MPKIQMFKRLNFEKYDIFDIFLSIFGKLQNNFYCNKRFFDY